MKRSYSIRLGIGEGAGWDEAVFDRAIDSMAETGLDTLHLAFTNAEFKSHPELKGPETVEKAKAKEIIGRVRERGIRVIPEVNFSLAHAQWTKDWQYRIGSPEYYTFCSDLIEEAAEYCGGPEIIHLGLDEESYWEVCSRDYIVLRNGKKKWDDFRFLMECCRKVGARPAAWADIYWLDPVNCAKNVSRDMILYPWYYGAMKHKNMQTHEQWEAWLKANMSSYANHLRYWQNDDLLELQRRALTECAAAGYDVVPCVSICYGCDENAPEVLEWCKS